MNSIKLWKTAQTPSAFGMPISGHTFGVTAGVIAGVTSRATDACAAATTLVVRERAVITAATGALEGGAGVAASDFPGTTAWRPPTC